jgi:UDP-glucuronate 4-epimerase
LVTGGAGFIGSQLVRGLLERGDSVAVLDNFDPYYSVAQKRENLRGLSVRLIEGDIRDSNAVKDALAGVDVVAHLAAKAGVRNSIERPAEYIDNNVVGTQVLIEGMVAAGVKRVVYASSSSIYGVRTDGPFRETDCVDNPVSPYAASKLAGELLFRAASNTWGMSVTSLRLFTVYGPRQRPEMAIHLFAERALAGEAIPRFGDGESRRDYTFVSDIVDGFLLAIDRPSSYAVYNLGNGNPVSLNELISMLGEALEVEIKIEQLGDQVGDVPVTWADVSLAGQEIGYSASVSLLEGLRRFVAWKFSSR